MITVLFVDDEPAVLSSLQRLLRQDRASLSILTAKDPTAALQLLDSTHVHAVVSDLRMAGMDGIGLLQQVRERVPEAIRILLTGTPDEPGTEIAHTVLTKPCSRQALLSALGVTGGPVG